MKRVLSFLMTFALFVTCFSNVAFAEEATGESNEAVYANETNAMTVNVRMGETIIDAFVGNANLGEYEERVVNAAVTEATDSVPENYRVAKLATNTATYNGQEKELEKCLFTFTAVENTENTYVISHVVDNSTTIYFASGVSNATIPCVSNPNNNANLNVVVGRDDDTFNFNNTYISNGQNASGYLYFHRNIVQEGNNTVKLYFNRNSGTDGDNTKFYLFTKDPEAGSSDIPGYKMLTSEEVIVSGNEYLIAAKGADDAYYLLNPVQASSNKAYENAVKVIQPQTGIQLANGGVNIYDSGSEFKSVDACLFTFTKSGSNYVISAKAANGTTVYLNNKTTAVNEIPTTTNSSAVIYVEQKVGTSLFRFEDKSSAGNGGKYLYFHRGGGKFNRNSTDHNNCYFELYKPTTDTSVVSPIEGYEKVTSVGDIQNNGQYLIVSTNTDPIANPNAVPTIYNLLYPSTGTNIYDHVAKLANTLPKVAFTGVAAGTTPVVVGDITYNVTVPYEDVEFTLRKGESFAVLGELQNEDHEGNIVKKEVTVKSGAPYGKDNDNIEDGYYLIANGSSMNNGDSTLVLTNNATKQGETCALLMETADFGTVNYEQYIWNVKRVRTDEESGETFYTIQDLNGKYINIDGSHVKLEFKPQELTIKCPENATGNYFYIAEDVHRLNRYGGNSYNVTGYSGTASANDHWYFYTPSNDENNGTVQVTEVTANGAGTAKFTATSYNYTIHFVDTDALEALIAKAEEAFDPDSKEYFGEEAYVQALATAEDCLNNATAKTQAEIDEAKANLEAAIANLVEIPASTPAENGIKAGVAGYSLVLEGNIVVKFHMQIEEGLVTEENKENLYMEFTLDNDEVSDPIKSSSEEDGYYVFECPVPVKDMGTEITGTIKLYDDNGEVLKQSAEFTYTVQDYITYMKDKNEEDPSNYADEITLVEKMEAFGNSAATYFNKNATVDPMSDNEKAALEASLKLALGLVEDAQPVLPTEDIYYGSSLLLRSDTVLRHYFIGDVTLDNNANPGWKKVEKADYCYVEYEGITADKLGELVTVTVQVSNGESITITYSPLTYAYLALESNDDEKLICLMKAMYDYWQAADAYIPKNESN